MTDEKSYTLRVKPITAARKVPKEQQIRDTFQTPNYAIDLLLPFIPKHITHVWECAAGGRKISRKLELAGYTVFSTDLQEAEGVLKHNFITDPFPDLSWGIFSIITNPPFSIKDLFVERCFEYGVPFALLINMDYSQQMCRWIQKGCQKIVPVSRISYLTPNLVSRVNNKLGTQYRTIDDIPNDTIYKFSSAQFHSGWLTSGFNLSTSETIVELSVKDRHNF
jgi:hypothetical protein